MKKEYTVWDLDGNHDYDIKFEYDGSIETYKMFRSKAEHWSDSSRGEKLFTIVNNNLNMSIKMHDGKFKNHTYHHSMELRVLLNLINDNEYRSQEYVVKKMIKM